MIENALIVALIDAGSVGVVKTSQASVQGTLNTVYFWAGALAVVFVVVSAFRFVISNGDSSQIAQARMGIIAALIGIVLIFSAFIITNFTLGAFQ